MGYIKTKILKQPFSNIEVVENGSLTTVEVVAGEYALDHQAIEEQLRDEIAVLSGELMVAKEETRLVREQLSQWTRMSMIGVAFAEAVHRIKNSLTAIIAESQLLEREIDESHPGYESVDMISKAGWRVLGVVEKLLASDSNEEPEFEPVQVNETIKSAINFLDVHLSQKNIDLKVELDEGLPLVSGNFSQIEELWVNFLINACHALPEGRTGELEVISRMSSSHTGIEVVVKDNGSGIFEENLANIFEPFFSSRIGKGGNGLGLTVCQMIVEQHGGMIQVDSEVGMGTVFTVYIPVMERIDEIVEMLFGISTSEDTFSENARW